MKKHILITGSTDGIGKLAAINLAKEGHFVYLHGRSSEKLNSTIEEVKRITGSNNIDGFVADLSDLDATKQFADDVKKNVKQIDILINNAGVFKNTTRNSMEGYDLRFTVNYLAPFLLTKELLPLIENGTKSRIINLSSAAQSTISFEAMLGKRNISENEAYAQSKLALTIWSFYLAKQLRNVVVIAVNPGSLLNTKMAKEAYGQHWSSADKGANILVDLALADKHQVHSGEYFDNDSGAYANAHSDAYKEEAIKNLIDFTNKLIDL